MKKNLLVGILFLTTILTACSLDVPEEDYKVGPCITEFTDKHGNFNGIVLRANSQNRK